MNLKQTMLTLCVLIAAVGDAQKMDRDAIMRKLITDDYALAKNQYLYMMKQVPKDSLPQTFDKATNKLI